WRHRTIYPPAPWRCHAAARTSSVPRNCGRRRPASNGPVYGHSRGSDGKPTRPAGRDAAPDRWRKDGTSGRLPFGNAFDREALDKLADNPGAGCADRHKEAQFPRYDFAEEPISAQAFAHGIAEACKFNAVSPHDPDAAQLQPFGQVENCSPFDQSGVSIIGC